MKYIVVNARVGDQIYSEYPIIFPDALVHS